MLLKGVKVLDLSNYLPGPMCSLFLADLGADVIKVEPLAGDYMRQIEKVKDKSSYFEALNRNKKSVAINLKAKQGQEIFRKLAKKSDVIIEGFRPGKVKSLGLDYDKIKKINPKIIYCSITGYGQKVSYKYRAGHDLNFNSVSGVIDVLSNKPFVPGMQIADVASALVASFSIASSLYAKNKNGKGNYIDVSMLDSALSLINMHIARESLNPKERTMLAGTAPCYNVYETKDLRYVSLGAIETKFWEIFCKVTDRKDLLKEQFNQNKVWEVNKIFKTKTAKEWGNLNKKYDFCCEPIKKVKELFEDNEIRQRKVLQNIDGIVQVGMPAIFSNSKVSYRKAPGIGENTNEVLLALGYSEKLIDAMKRASIIG